jgi:hypothetical protein
LWTTRGATGKHPAWDSWTSSAVVLVFWREAYWAFRIKANILFRKWIRGLVSIAANDK